MVVVQNFLFPETAILSQVHKKYFSELSPNPQNIFATPYLGLCVGPLYGPGSKLLVLGMVIQPLIGNPYNGYINPYYWVDDHPLLYGNNVSLDPSTYVGKKRTGKQDKGTFRCLLPWLRQQQRLVHFRTGCFLLQ